MTDQLGRLAIAYDAAHDAADPRRALLRVRRSVESFCESNPQTAPGWLLSARVQADLENYEEARKRADHLLSTWPASSHPDRREIRAEALTLLGQVAAEEGLLWQASHWYEQAISEGKQSSPDVLELAYDGLVGVFRELGRDEDARRALRDGIAQLEKAGATHVVLDGHEPLLRAASAGDAPESEATLVPV